MWIINHFAGISKLVPAFTERLLTMDKVKMQVPEGVGGISFGGETYSPDEKGIIEIPADKVSEALIHGLTMAPIGKKGK